MICENINIIQNAWGEDAVKHWTAGSLLKEIPEWETESVRCRSPLRCGHNDSGRTFSNKPNTLTKKNTPVMELLRPFKCFLNEDESVGAGEACEWLLALWQKPPAQSSHLQEKKDGEAYEKSWRSNLFTTSLKYKLQEARTFWWTSNSFPSTIIFRSVNSLSRRCWFSSFNISVGQEKENKQSLWVFKAVLRQKYSRSGNHLFAVKDSEDVESEWVSDLLYFSV